MKKYLLCLSSILILGLVVGFSGYALAGEKPNEAETDAAIADAQAMLDSLQNDLSTINADEVNTEPIEDAIQEASANISVAVSSRNSGNLENALEEAQEAIETILQAQQRLKN